MTDHRNNLGKPEHLSFNELMAKSSVGGDTDLTLNDVCTDEEAETFAAEYSRSQAESEVVFLAAGEVT